jgi:hypothetical protein
MHPLFKFMEHSQRAHVEPSRLEGTFAIFGLLGLSALALVVLLMVNGGPACDPSATARAAPTRTAGPAMPPRDNTEPTVTTGSAGTPAASPRRADKRLPACPPRSR